MMEQLVYVSRAAPTLCAADLHDIIRTAHNRNRQTGLTGALLLLDGRFLQVLEGPPQAVRACFGRIGRDPRHHGIELRSLGPVAQPDFPQHWMALCCNAELPAHLRSRLRTLMAGEQAAPQAGAPALVAMARACVAARADQPASDGAAAPSSGTAPSPPCPSRPRAV